MVEDFLWTYKLIKFEFTFDIQLLHFLLHIYKFELPWIEKKFHIFRNEIFL